MKISIATVSPGDDLREKLAAIAGGGSVVAALSRSIRPIAPPSRDGKRYAITLRA